MKREERIAYNALKNLDSKFNIVYEPDGNKPPDFSINGSIAVEVRRLNQQYYNENGKQEGLEKISISLIQSIQTVLNKIGDLKTGNYYLLAITYSRPFEKDKSLPTRIENDLRNYALNCESSTNFLFYGCNLSIIIFKTSTKLNRTFAICGQSGIDSSGVLNDIYIDNINHCILEKTQKINPYFQNYSQWWLLLVDAILPGEINYTTISKSLLLNKCWQKIIIVSPKSVILFSYP